VNVKADQRSVKHSVLNATEQQRCTFTGT